ncbi:hypothetical protein BV898_03883 [Hypsibius exemplaris]|uniref:Uncharacterized protein n=1 Tax=Hypsibius exemplaris TaxID=2072580 RepID=A0A1W0X3G7_HYPEX|nr:hypothetical protein BV898_03883 [Hypsibius exemplaris]
MVSLVLFLSMTLLGVSRAAFPAMPPFPQMGNFAALSQLQNLQKQGQSQGSSAATGDGSADFGSLQSQQSSNTLTNAKGTNSQAGSLGACSGGSCGISGAAQLTASGQSQKQGQLNNQNILGASGQLNLPNLFGNQLAINNATQQKQQQSQSQISGASVGQGSAALGNVSSVQNTEGQTGDKGANVSSSSLGQGLGSQVALSGAVQATGQNQNAKQEGNQASQNTNAGTNEGPLASGANALQHANQSQSQSQGEGAAVGQGSVGEGAINSAQSSNVNTSNKGTLVSSNSAGSAAGKGGLKLSGASSSSAQQANQKQQTLNLQQSSMNH